MPKRFPVPPVAAPNSPSIVRTSFLCYLKTAFPYKKDWVHPISSETFTHDSIKGRLQEYMKLEPQGYKALWYLWTTQATRSFIADAMNYSGPTIKRRWDKSIDTVLVMLFFPSLQPEAFELYGSI